MRYIQSIPIGILTSIAFTGLLIYFAFVLIEKYYIAFVKQNRFFDGLGKFLPKAKLFCWFTWFVVSVYFLILYSPFITIVFLIGIYLFTKDFWLNIYAGVFLMNKVKEGDYIEIHNQDIKGVVRKMNNSDVEIQNDNKEIIYIPNSLLLKATFIKKEEAGNKYKNVFMIAGKSKSGERFSKKRIEEILVSCPWTVLSKPIDIEFADNDGIRISVFTFSKDTARLQEMFVSDELKK